MSKLERLIAELCPDGVEYRELWSITTWDKRFNSVEREKQPHVISYPYLLAADLFKLEQPEGDVFLLSTGEKTGWTTEESAIDYLCEGEIVSIPWGKSRPVKEVLKYYKGKFVTADNRIVTSNDTAKLLNRYLYYWMLTNSEIIDGFYRGSGIKHPSMSSVLNMKIPLPPLPVQREIVRILDNFTELTARKKQYEYYRDSLLTFGNEVSIVTLGEIATIIRGGNFQKKDFIENGIPCIHYGQIYTKYGLSAIESFTFIEKSVAEKSKFAQKNDIIMAVTSENVEDVCKCVVWFGEDDVAVSGHTAIIKHNQNAKFLAYYFNTAMFFKDKIKLCHGTKVIEVTPSTLANIKIPVPPLAEQQRIVAILDRFDTLCNDISNGLPAEIKARQQQYEYYRDKLLTFKNIAEQEA